MQQLAWLESFCSTPAKKKRIIHQRVIITERRLENGANRSVRQWALRTMISLRARTSSPPQALRAERPALSWAFSAPYARSGAYLLFWAARSPRSRSSRGTSSPSQLQRCQRACPSKARWALNPAWHVAPDGSAAQREVRVTQLETAQDHINLGIKPKNLDMPHELHESLPLSLVPLLLSSTLITAAAAPRTHRTD